MRLKALLLLLLCLPAQAGGDLSLIHTPGYEASDTEQLVAKLKSGALSEKDALTYLDKINRLAYWREGWLKESQSPRISNALLELSRWPGLTDDMRIGIVKYVGFRDLNNTNTPAIIQNIRAGLSASTSPRVFAALSEDFPLKAKPEDPNGAGVFQVASVYQEAKKKMKEAGTSTVLEIPGQGKFLLTSAHLLGGEAPTVSVKGGELSLHLKSGLIDNDNDLALVPLPKDLPAAAAYDPATGVLKPTNRLQGALVDGSVQSDQAWYYNGNKYYPVNFDGRVLGNKYSIYRWLKPSWAKTVSTLEKEGESSGTTAMRPELVADGRQVHLREKTAPGLSGTLLLENIEDGQSRVRGVLSQYNVYFRSSYFASDQAIRDLIAAYAKGKRGYTSETRWKYKNGLTYRDYGNGTREVNFLQRPTGNGDYVDPGNGDYVDPGNGDYVDPGNGDYVDPGTGCPVSSGESLDGKTKNELEKLASKVQDEAFPNPNKILEKYGISFGMQYQGKTVIGFEAVAKNNPKQKILLYANPMVLPFMKKNADKFDFRPVEAGADLTPYAIAKAKLAFPKSLGKKDPIKLKVTAVNSSLDGSELFLGAKGVDFHIPAAYRGDINQYSYLQVHLDAKGRPLGQKQKEYFPIVEAVEPLSKTRWLVDTRQLFFTDISDVAQRLDPHDSLPKSFGEAFDLHSKSIQLKFHRVNDALELSTTYLAPKCYDRMKDLGVEEDRPDLGKYTHYECD